MRSAILYWHLAVAVRRIPHPFHQPTTLPTSPTSPTLFGKCCRMVGKIPFHRLPRLHRPFWGSVWADKGPHRPLPQNNSPKRSVKSVKSVKPLNTPPMATTLRVCARKHHTPRGSTRKGYKQKYNILRASKMKLSYKYPVRWWRDDSNLMTILTYKLN